MRYIQTTLRATLRDKYKQNRPKNSKVLKRIVRLNDYVRYMGLVFLREN